MLNISKMTWKICQIQATFINALKNEQEMSKFCPELEQKFTVFKLSQSYALGFNKMSSCLVLFVIKIFCLEQISQLPCKQALKD